MKIVLIPCINLICDPDFLNQKIINYLTDKENTSKLLKKTSFATNYEVNIFCIYSWSGSGKTENSCEIDRSIF